MAPAAGDSRARPAVLKMSRAPLIVGNAGLRRGARTSFLGEIHMRSIRGAGGAMLCFCLALAAPAALAQYVSLTGTTVEHFDTLLANGTGSTLPTGWRMLEAGSNANTTYAADN